MAIKFLNNAIGTSATFTGTTTVQGTGDSSFVGKVGIGTASPRSTLEVNGQVLISNTFPALDFVDTNSFTDPNDRFRIRAGGNQGLVQWYDNSANSLLTTMTFEPNGNVIVPNGNVGIGTPSPSAKLHIRQDDDTVYDPSADDGQRSVGATIQLNNNSTTNNTFGQIMYDTDSSNQAVARIVFLDAGSASSAMAFVTENAEQKGERMRIAADGNVGIGTDSPNAKLETAQSLTGTPANNNISLKVTDINTSHAADAGGSIMFSGVWNSSGSILGQAPYIKASKSNATSGDYGFGLRLGVRATGSGGSNVAMTIADNSDIRFNTYSAGTLVTDASGNITASSGGGAGGPYLPLTAGSTKPLTGDLFIDKTDPTIQLKAGTQDVAWLGYFGGGSDGQLILFNNAGVAKVALNGEASSYLDGGNVGIGTTSPDDRLDVVDGNAQMVFGTASSDRTYIQFKHNAVPVDGEELCLMDFSGYNSASQNTRYVILTTKAEDVTDGSEDGSLTFQTMKGGTATQALTVRSGKVGIGTDSPDYLLDLYKGTNTSGTTTGTTLQRLWNYVGGDINQQKTFVDFVFQDDNNNEYPQVRIGAEVGHNGNADTQEKEGSGAFVVYTNNATGSTPGANSLAERMRVDYLGKVGIGTTSPTRTLQVGNGANLESFNIGDQAGKSMWINDYAISITNIKDLLYSDGNALPNGGGYRFTAHIAGTGTEQVSRAVFWNDNGTWRLNKTYQSGTNSNHIDFIVTTGGLPGIKTYHANNYTATVYAERLELKEGNGTDNAKGYFGTDSYISNIANAIRVEGDLTVAGGDISLVGTGRIQGVDTVSSNTDAANKLYVDNAVAGVPIGNYVTLATAQTITGAKTIDTLKIGSANKIQFANNDFIRYEDATGVGRFHFDSDGGTNNSSVQAATFVGALSGNATTATTASSATNLYGLGYIQSTSSGVSYTNNYQVRENYGGGSNTAIAGAPQLAFHWSGVVASSIMMESSGRIAIRDNPGTGYENFIAAGITGTTGSFSGVTVTGTLTASIVGNNSSQTRDKLRVWTGSTYSIGMMSGYGYGGLGGNSTGTEYAMSFQMSNTANRGWWWGDTSHTNLQGAMSLTTTGNAVIATSLSIGYGESIRTAATQALEVNGTVYATPITYASNQSEYVLKMGASNNTAFDQGIKLKSDSGGSSYISINARSEDTLVLKAGNVGIGTDSPNARLDVVGTSSSSSSGLLKLKSTTQFLSAPGHMIDFVRSNNTIRGFVGMNQYSVTYSTSSDYRLKRNIVPIADSIDRIKKLKPSRFNWDDGPDDYVVDGFIAHEVADVIPEAITGEKDDVDEDNAPVYQSIDQSKIVPLLTAALQEAVARIEALELRINKLEKK